MTEIHTEQTSSGWRNSPEAGNIGHDKSIGLGTKQSGHESFVCCCELKWFNESKGFGFVVPCDSPNQDAFIHVSTLQQRNIRELGEHALLDCRLQPTDRGLQVLEVVGLKDPGRQDTKLTKIPLAPDAAPTYAMAGTVKWYSPEKGYGFIAAEDARKDIFIHQSCLQRHGIGAELFTKNQRVQMQIRDVEQGREVVHITLA